MDSNMSDAILYNRGFIINDIENGTSTSFWYDRIDGKPGHKINGINYPGNIPEFIVDEAGRVGRGSDPTCA